MAGETPFAFAPLNGFQWAKNVALSEEDLANVGRSRNCRRSARQPRWRMPRYTAGRCPSLLISVSIVVIPGIQTVYSSLTDWNGFAEKKAFIGMPRYTAGRCPHSRWRPRRRSPRRGCPSSPATERT